MLSQFATSIENQALRVHEPDAVACLLSGQAVESKETQKLHSDADTCRTGTKEEDAVVRQWLVRSSRSNLCGIDETRQHNSTSALNIVVENGVAVAEGVKVFKGVIGREILI